MTPNEPRKPARRPFSGAEWFLVVATLACLMCCLLPMTQEARDGEGYVRSQVSLRRIGLALLQYHGDHGTLPPAVVRDKGGKPLYSWRVLVLPYLEAKPAYDRFKLDEPWDSPDNLAVLQGRFTSAYQPALGGWASEVTHYQALVGPGTAFERPGLKLPDDFPDGPANTLLVVEAAEAVPWSKPADLVYDLGRPLPALGGLFTKSVRLLGYRVGWKSGFNAAFADGSVRLIASDTDERTLRALITRNGGEPVDLSKLE
jgi:prepilin-type processing-associated H-X9-DG protein